jgi:cytochrome d ubiquinol oxidase subunit II
LADVPLAFALVGLVFYTVLGGADFGAGVWQLRTGRGSRSSRIREHAYHAMGPVWEANHVWLIFAVTVVWTAYPVVFASIASTLAFPLFIAALGIIMRGTTYALRSAPAEGRRRWALETLFSISSILTPLALGMTVGGIASRRVPAGNAAGDQVTSWLNPTSAVVGVLAVVAAAYLAAVFLAGDARRLGEPDLEGAFRLRALVAGVAAGALAVGALGVLAADAPSIFHRLVAGRALPALVVSLLAGLATLALVWRRRYEPARYSAAVAVAAVVAGWALAQLPEVLRGVDIDEAAAPYDTLVAVTVAIVAGGVIVFPSLALLFRLVLTGRFDQPLEPERPPPARAAMLHWGLLARLAVACLIAGVGLTTIADAAWAHAVGVSALLAFVVLAYPVALPPEILRTRPDDRPSKN